MAFPDFSLETNTALNTKLVLTGPIFLKHVDCSDTITTSTRFKLGIHQAYKLCNLMTGDYLIRVIGLTKQCTNSIVNVIFIMQK